MSREEKTTNGEFIEIAGNKASRDSGEKTKYTTKPGQAKELVLFIDGNQSVCPFTAPIPFSGSMGQVQIMRLPCNTLCPFARIEGDTYVTRCTGEYNGMTLTQEADAPIIKIQ